MPLPELLAVCDSERDAWIEMTREHRDRIDDRRAQLRVVANEVRQILDTEAS